MRTVNTASPVKRHFIFITCFLSGCRVLTDWNITRSSLITLLCSERAHSRCPVWGCGCLMLNIGWVKGRLLWLSVRRSAWMTGESSAVWLADRRSNRLLYWLTARNHTDPHDRKHWVWNIWIVCCWFITWFISIIYLSNCTDIRVRKWIPGAGPSGPYAYHYADLVYQLC